MAEVGTGAMVPKFFRHRRIFKKFNASSENFQTFVVSTEKGFEFYRKIIKLAPLPTPPVPGRH